MDKIITIDSTGKLNECPDFKNVSNLLLSSLSAKQKFLIAIDKLKLEATIKNNLIQLEKCISIMLESDFNRLIEILKNNLPEYFKAN